MKLTDGKKTISIKLCTWEGTGYSPDWSNDFFNAGSLPYDEEQDVYIVPDVDYCIEQAMDWKNSVGDFAEDKPNPNNAVLID